ncbi:MAG: hypothetical protein K8I27_12900 [Planctomycetes bacterium]|nr:hypothetical protein [Planctomycetota bacterium]
MYERDGSFEAEAINAAIAGVGNSVFEALHSFEEMAFSLAIAAVGAGARLTYDPDPEDGALYTALKSDKLTEQERSEQRSERGIVAFGDLNIGLQQVDSVTRPKLQSAKVELVAAG